MCTWGIHRGTYCPELWTQDSNAIVCDYAYSRYVNGSDLLHGGYAKGAFHIVELQLAKAAWRTAGWLKTIASQYLGNSAAEDAMEENEVQVGLPEDFREGLGGCVFGGSGRVVCFDRGALNLFDMTIQGQIGWSM